MAKPSNTPASDATRGAGYRDVLDAPEHLVAEVIDGVLHTHPRTALPHARAASKLGMVLGSLFDRGGGNGETGGWYILDEPELHLGEDILVPDLAGWRRERMPAQTDAAYCSVAPDWICEILSASTRAIDLGPKRDIYAREGVAHLWFIDPVARELEVFELRQGQWILLESAVGQCMVSVPPFAAAPFNLGDLWWTATPKFPTSGSIQENPAAARP